MVYPGLCRKGRAAEPLAYRPITRRISSISVLPRQQLGNGVNLLVPDSFWYTFRTYRFEYGVEKNRETSSREWIPEDRLDHLVVKFPRE
jgi:hypothetical protein